MKKILRPFEYSVSFWSALFWVAVEAVGKYPATLRAFLEISWDASKLSTLKILLAPLALALLPTWILFLAVEAVCGFLGRFFPWATRVSFRVAAFFVFLTPVYFLSGNSLSQVSGGLAFVSLAIFVIRKSASPPVLASLRTHVLAVCLLTLVFYSNRQDGWYYSSPGVAKSGSKPSFLWVAFDGLPADFEMTADGGTLIDTWANIETNATVFREAYATVNSTYASWFSALSGRYPFRSGVETLFPGARDGEVLPTEFLPRKLKEAGYETVFMTDCASTSFFSENSGFNRRFEPDRGATGCVSAYLNSRHLLLDDLLSQQRAHPFHASLDSECSLGYRPETLFEKAYLVTQALNHSKRPYFLAIHSCATAVDSLRRRELGHTEDEAFLRKTAPAAMRAAKVLVDEVRTRKNSWAFLFSDHGVNQGETASSKFSHAIGLPLGRSQYHVPLLVVGESARQMNVERVSLADLYPTVLNLAGLELGTVDGVDLLRPRSENRSLLLASALPLPAEAATWSLLRGKVELGRQGDATFTSAFENELRAKGPVALLQGQLRFLFAPDGDVQVFEERSGLPVETPVSGVAEAYRELCRVYSRGVCRGGIQG